MKITVELSEDVPLLGGSVAVTREITPAASNRTVASFVATMEVELRETIQDRLSKRGLEIDGAGNPVMEEGWEAVQALKLTKGDEVWWPPLLRRVNLSTIPGQSNWNTKALPVRRRIKPAPKAIPGN